jgi:nitrogen-specific signal transduction histidine kinase
MTGSEQNSPAAADRATIVLDENDVVSSWDKAAEKSLGYSAMEAVGEHISALAPWDVLALPGIDQIKQHSALFDRYARHHLVGRKSGKFFLAEVTAHVECGPRKQCQAVIRITPVEADSPSLVDMPGTMISQLPEANGLLQECNNMMMVLLGQAELLKDGTAKEKELGQNVELLVEAAVRMTGVWPKLRAFLEFSADVDSNGANGGHPPPCGCEDSPTLTLAGVPALTGE